MAIMDVMGVEEQAALFDVGLKKRGEFGDVSWVVPSSTRDVGANEWLRQKGKGDDKQDASVISLLPIKSGDSRSVRFETRNIFEAKEKVDQQTIQKEAYGSKRSAEGPKKLLEENWVSVFIGNLPPFANNRWVFDKFNIVGKVADYFVSSRVSKISKKPFGFVRFYSLEDANKAVYQFNGAWVDGFRLEVDLARFPRRVLSVEEGHKDTTVVEEEREGHKGIKDSFESVIAHKFCYNPKKSFANVLMGKSEEPTTEGVKNLPSKIKVKAEVKECGWLKASVVAKIIWGVSFGDVMKNLLSNVQGIVSISRLGIRKVIVSFISVKDRNSAISRGGWMGMVEDVREWGGELVCMDKLWFISCYGIPITAWNIGSFKSIANVWGSLVNIDYATSSGEDYSVAKFVIEAETVFTNTSIDLMVGNEVFPVNVTGVMAEVLLGHVGDFEAEKWNNGKVSTEGSLHSQPMLCNDGSFYVAGNNMAAAIDLSSGQPYQIACSQKPNPSNVMDGKLVGTDESAAVSPSMDVSGNDQGLNLHQSDCMNILHGDKGIDNNSLKVQDESLKYLSKFGIDENIFSVSVQDAPISSRIEMRGPDAKLDDPRSQSNQKVIGTNSLQNGQEFSYDIFGEANNHLDTDKECVQSLWPESGQNAIYCADGQIHVMTDGQPEDVTNCDDGKERVRKGKFISSFAGPVEEGDRAEVIKDFQQECVQPSLFMPSIGMQDLNDETNSGPGHTITEKKVDLPCLELDADLTSEQFESGIDGSVDVVKLDVVEKEIKAMMGLGYFLDIPNASHFEDAVREATVEDVENDFGSIGARVKSKRKYAGKSKVQYGCRIRKR